MSRDLLKFWQISINISKTVHNRDILPMKSYMAYQMAQTPVTLNDLEGHSSVSGLFKCKSFTFVQRSNLQDFNWHARVAPSLSDSWASCPHIFQVYLNICLIFQQVCDCPMQRNEVGCCPTNIRMIVKFSFTFSGRKRYC